MDDFALRYRGSPWYVVIYAFAALLFGSNLLMNCGLFGGGAKWHLVTLSALNSALSWWWLCLELLRRRHAGVSLNGDSIVASDWRGRVSTIPWEGCERVSIDPAGWTAQRVAVLCGKQEKTVGWFPPRDATRLADEIRRRLSHTAA